MAPPTDCLAPIGEKQLVDGLKKEFEADFFTSTTRPPDVYRGNPFQIEAALAYGGKLPAEEPAQVLRFANRVPLLYQAGACAITKAVTGTSWRTYELQQPKKIPAGSKVTVTTLFDNTAKNKYNPAPEKEVFWSEQSWDEMYAPQARITVDSRALKTTATSAPQQK